MKSGAEWYKRYPREFLDGVQGLGPELIGAYSVILELIYARGGETLRDDHHLGGVMGCSTRKAKTLTDQLIAKKKITLEGEFITNSVATREAKTRRQVSETNAKSGRKGGEKSSQSRKNNALAKANASSENQAEKRREEKKPPNPQRGDASDLFGEAKPPPEKTPQSVLAEAIPEQLASEFVDHRKSMRKPLSVLAATKIANNLRSFQDPVASVNNSIANGWAGVFDRDPPRNGGNQPPSGDATLARVQRRYGGGA